MAAADMIQLGMVVEASIAGGWGDRFFLWLSPPRSFFLIGFLVGKQELTLNMKRNA